MSLHDVWEPACSFLHDDPLVIEMKIANSRVKRILVDSGSLADIITLDCLRKLKYTEKDVTPTSQLMIGFGGGSVYIPSSLSN